MDQFAQGHECNFGEWEVISEASCTEKGLEMRSCACGERETRKVEIANHDFDDNGYCSVCGAFVFDIFEGILTDVVETSEYVTEDNYTEAVTEANTEFAYDDTKNPGDYQYIEKNDTIYVLAPSGALNLRTADYQKKTSVATGTALQRVAVSTDGVWSKIIYAIEGENFELYVNNKYTTLLADLDAGFVAGEKTLTVKAAGLKIHIAPETDEKWQEDVKIIGYYAEDDEVKVLAENTETGWYKVEFSAYGGTTGIGYILNDPNLFIFPEPELNTTESTTEAATEATTEPEVGK